MAPTVNSAMLMRALAVLGIDENRGGMQELIENTGVGEGMKFMELWGKLKKFKSLQQWKDKICSKGCPHHVANQSSIIDVGRLIYTHFNIHGQYCEEIIQDVDSS